MRMTENVLIVGAGPTGLVLALTLNKFKIPFKIIDKKEGPGNESRAMLMVSGSIEHYSQLGIAEAVLNDVLVLDKAYYHGKTTIQELDFQSFGDNQTRFDSIFTYPQDDHERMLIQLLNEDGHKVDWETSFKSLTQDDAEVTVEMERDGDCFTENYSYVIGTDGGSSPVRKSLSIPFEGETNDELFFVSDVELANEELQGKNVHIFLQDEDILLCFTLRDSKTKRLIGIIPNEIAQKDTIEMSDLEPSFKERFGIEISETKWFSEYKIHHRLAENFRKGRVFLAGDAAHIHSPVGGQGMNAGIADAINLGWKLAHTLKKRTNPNVLDTYEQERHDFANSLVKTTDQAFKIVIDDRPIISKLRSFAVPYLVKFFINRTNFINEKAYNILSQLNIQYEETALNATDSSDDLLGSRLPYYGENLSFTDSMDWHIQVYGEIETAFADFLSEQELSYHVLEWNSDMKKAGFSKNSAYLIRPDGYIAWVSPNQDTQSLADYLNQWQIN